MRKISILLIVAVLLLSGCKKTEELTLEEIENYGTDSVAELLEKTKYRPWEGQKFAPGKSGGTWKDSITSDPKTFNLIVADGDGETNALLNFLTDYLIDYNYTTKEWEPHIAAPRVEVHEADGTMDVFFTLRDDLYWTYYGSDKKIKVTSDDAVFWYDEIDGEEQLHLSAYTGQFLAMEDGTIKHVDIEKIDDLTFVYHFPRITAEPLLHCNGSFGPMHVFKPVKDKEGVEGLKKIFSVSADPKTIPSMGKYYLVEYTSGQRLVYKKNPYYWEKDANGTVIPYPDEMIMSIVPDKNTQFLMFKEGSQEDYNPKTEEISELVKKQGDKYTIYNNGGTNGASLWTFNENPINKDKPYYEWFTCKEFRQAMSCLLNRERIISQVYNGLAEPCLYLFPKPNAFYNEEITLKYVFDLKKAEELLAKAGMKKDKTGVLRDKNGTPVEFDLTVTAESPVASDIASIIVDEAQKVGMKINVRTTDFQKLVEQMTSTYDWQSLFISLGTSIFPSQGSNVWPSNTPLHIWYPMQPSPATEWEARIDYLYNEGCCTIDHDKAKKIWDEYQSIILEQCPLIYLMRPISFYALSNRWDQTNLYYDPMGGATTDYVYLK
ncbi:MAG: ABC transporter substrate-binding protein [Spirochaetaceae bacterium]|nr:ABC transporter substrate-binding protein [Spirochaetaceae bacterium]